MGQSGTQICCYIIYNTIIENNYIIFYQSSKLIVHHLKNCSHLIASHCRWIWLKRWDFPSPALPSLTTGMEPNLQTTPDRIRIFYLRIKCCATNNYILEPEPANCLRIVLHGAEIYNYNDWSAISTTRLGWEQNLHVISVGVCTATNKSAIL